MTTTKKKVAAIQLASGSNVSANLLETERLTEAAARQGADLVVLPENFAFIDIIFFAMVAAFIAFRLRSVLGLMPSSSALPPLP